MSLTAIVTALGSISAGITALNTLTGTSTTLVEKLQSALATKQTVEIPSKEDMQALVDQASEDADATLLRISKIESGETVETTEEATTEEATTEETSTEESATTKAAELLEKAKEIIEQINNVTTEVTPLVTQAQAIADALDEIKDSVGDL